VSDCPTTRLLALAAALVGALAAAPAAADSALPDPTRPAVQRSATAQAPAPRWHLESTLVSPERRLAVIDGRMVRAGDRLGDAQVLEIGPDQVTLRSDERIVHLRLLPAEATKRQRP